MVEGSEVLMAYKKEAFSIEKVDSPIEESFTLRTIVAPSPKLENDNVTQGGPIYISMGEKLLLNMTNMSVESSNGTFY